MSINRDFDAVIVGASLGGASAAICLGRQGLRVALIDKAQFPRRKPCGEGLSSYGLKQLKALDLLDSVLRLPHVQYRGYRLKANQHISILESPWGSGITVQRSLLDQTVHEKAVSFASVESIIGEVKELSPHTVTINDRTISTGAIIIADGTNSKLAKKINCSVQRRGPSRNGIAATFIGSFKTVPQYINILIKPGVEIYCTPLSDTRLNISMLTASNSSVHLRDLLLSPEVLDAAFAECTFTGELELAPLGRVGIGNVCRVSPDDSMYLVGDAKEEFDPCGGMGMSHALRSGILAAEAITKNLQKEQSPNRISRWYQHQERRYARPMRHFTQLSYSTMRIAQSFPYFLRAAATPFAKSFIKSFTKELS